MKSSMIKSIRKRLPIIVFSWSISLIMAALTGCSDKGHCAMHQFDNDLVQIYTTIDAMPAMVKDRKTNKIWNTAFDLYTVIQSITNKSVRGECIDRFTNTLFSITIDTSRENIFNKKELGALEDELFNYWAFAQWGFNLVNNEHPNDPASWDILITALGNYSRMIQAIDETVTKDDAVKRIHAWHKKNVTTQFNGWVRCIDLMYSSRRDLMSSVCRREVCIRIKTALGELPSEMAKDDAETLTKDTEGK